jgi:hypothetical protein
MHAVKHSGSSRITAIGTAIAIVFSAYSLWETSLKRADLSVFVPGVVTYTRDTTASVDIQPSGGFEVLAVPITIANSGARDAPIVALHLDVKNPKTDLSARFEATFIAEPSYFNPAFNADRQRTPFSALVIAGRSAWRGTVIFYPVSYSNGMALTPITKIRAFNQAMDRKYATEMASAGAVRFSQLREKFPNLPEFAELDAYQARVLNQNGKIDVTLRLVGPPPGGWLDRLLDAPLQPITLTLQAPDFDSSNVGAGELVRVRLVNPET